MTGPAPSQTDGDRYVTWDAAYVLGALPGDERRDYEKHLKTCPACQARVAELSGIPPLLSRIGPDELAEPDPEHDGPPAELLDTLLAAVSARRRRRFIAAAAMSMAAAVLAFGLAIALRPDAFGLGSDAPAQASGQQLEMNKVAETPINATVAMTGYGWGTRIDMTCSYGDWGQSGGEPQNLAMVVVGHDGSRSQVATWLGLSGATALPSANTPLQTHEIAAVQLVSPESGTVLLERPL
ncbi:zf-HC2 domain-containing protein [Mycolicibacterium flavescens]|uniref:Anti-sigma factor n=1 Tax=Mycolicibacterium flavescens TaxID=1776 RepID=A0A1E3RMN8_MYCFV|nr:zf-HC2 domain-containing protein [Mycolicibacterium flavescens]MCV7281937.1 zf-HC2 domain-containing protein [Mycolicibacterium flavescens]ODQ90692.1 anti-sigma factor [Mycolicibacterium flavescens]